MIDLRNRNGSCAKVLLTLLAVLFIIGVLCWKAWNKFIAYVEEDSKVETAKSSDYAVVESGRCIINYKQLKKALIYHKEETIDKIGNQLMESGVFMNLTNPLYDYNYESGNLWDARNTIPSTDASNALADYAELLCYNKYPGSNINDVVYKMRYGTYIYPRGGFDCQSDKSKLKALKDNEPMYHVRGPLDTQCALALNEFIDLKQDLYTKLNSFGSAYVIKGLKAGFEKHLKNIDRDDGYDD